MAAAGVGNIKIVDNDVVSLSNLQRQILFKNEDLGKKVLAAKKNLLELNPLINIEILTINLLKKIIENILMVVIY